MRRELVCALGASALLSAWALLNPTSRSDGGAVVAIGVVSGLALRPTFERAQSESSVARSQLTSVSVLTVLRR